jgi:hypothetical protein
MPWPPFMAQNFAFAFAILTDTRTTQLFPRWLGYLNIWAPITFTPAVILQFFKSGPFALNRIVVFWLPAVVFGIQFVANVVWLLKAFSSEARETASAPDLSGWGSGAAAIRRSR